MCGICGFVTKNQEINQQILLDMNQTLVHRGPDEEGHWFGSGVALGHRRLSIIDLEGGHQPMTCANSSLHIVYNGEIYNYREIAKELEKEGLGLRTTSDTEVILLSYRLWGIDCLQKFIGMFSFALWDEGEKELILARDRMGQKPLHFFVSGPDLIFASEIKALLCHPEVSSRLDPVSLSKYLAYDYVPAPKSIFQGIQKLMPGSFLIWKNGKVEEKKYWRPDFSSHTFETETDLIVEIDKRIRESIRYRLVSDVPIGVFLSGGLDSSTLVAYMAEFLPSNQIKTFNIGFEEESFDERIYAKQVAELFSTDHQEEVLSAKLALDLIPKIADILDEPLADPSVIPTYLLSQFTRKYVKVVLGGDGGDEIFVGYENYRAAKYSSNYSNLPLFLKKLFFESWINRLSPSDKNLTLGYKFKRFIKGLDFPFPAANYVWLGSLTPHEQNQIFQEDFKQAMEKRTVDNTYDEVLSVQNSSINNKKSDFLLNLLASDLRLYLQDNILVKVDRASMANSLEVRAPFLDHHLVNLLTQTPIQRKFPGYQLKYLLKKVMEKRLPKNIVQRKKKGFGIPVTQWLKKELSPILEFYLSSDRLQKAGIFNPKRVQQLIQDHRENREDHRKTLWALLVFEIWRERYQPTI